jgi:hypothetical protein
MFAVFSIPVRSFFQNWTEVLNGTVKRFHHSQFFVAIRNVTSTQGRSGGWPFNLMARGKAEDLLPPQMGLTCTDCAVEALLYPPPAYPLDLR